MSKFSVVVPVFNIQEYISQCIRNILDQTFRDFELIIVDDGSTDRSGEICDRLASADERILVIHKKNGGLSDARNDGMKKATGEYIIFVDGDDYIEPDALKQIHEGIAEASDPDVLVTRIRQVFEDRDSRYMDPDMPIDLLKNAKKEDYIKWLFGKSDNTWPSVRYVVKRNLILKNGLRFRKGYLHEDIDWTSRLFLHAETFSCIDYYWYNHRKGRRGSITTTRNPKGLLDVIDITASNIRDAIYGDLPPDQRTIIFERLAESVFYNLGDYGLFNSKEKGLTLQSLDHNKVILRYARKFRHRLFVSFCRIFGFRTGLYLLAISKGFPFGSWGENH